MLAAAPPLPQWVSRFRVSRFSCGFGLSRFKAFKVQGLGVSRFRVFKVQGRSGLWVFRFWVFRFRVSKSSGFPRFRVFKVQGFQVQLWVWAFKVQGFQGSGFRGFQVQGFQSSGLGNQNILLGRVVPFLACPRPKVIGSGILRGVPRQCQAKGMCPHNVTRIEGLVVPQRNSSFQKFGALMLQCSKIPHPNVVK